MSTINTLFEVFSNYIPSYILCKGTYHKQCIIILLNCTFYRIDLIRRFMFAKFMYIIYNRIQ